MAILTKTEKYVAETYAKYFGRAANADIIDYYGLKENGKAEKASKILTNISADAGVYKGNIPDEQVVNEAFQNLFGRDASRIDMNKYIKFVEKGKNLPINSIVKKASKTDKAVYDNKMAVAVKYAELGGTKELDLSKISKGNLVNLKTVFTLTDLTNAIEDLGDNSGIPSSFDGKTFFLTTGVDAGKDFIGTNKDDLFIADNSTGVSKISAADTLDGGKGTEDTFKIYDDTTAAVAATTITAGSLPTLKNIENVALYNLFVGNVDLKKWDTVETLYVVNAKAGTTGFILGEKVTTVNFEDIAADQIVTFDNAVAAATIGVNDVTATTVTVDSAATAALKTLTVDAYGKESNVTLTQTTTNTIETLNITGRADLTLALTAGTLGTTVKTVDGSKAQGDLKFSNTTNMTSIKTGSGNDTVTVVAAVASGETIDLGAGNDKLIGTGAIAAGSIIDGGAGIDSLDAALVKVGNGGVFANFETLSLTTAITAPNALDMNLLTKSTITTIAIDAAVATNLKNVSTSQSLAVNAAAGAASNTTLLFKDVAGTADAYTINFSKDTVAAGVDAGAVSVEKIETVTVNSVGKTGANNIITLQDADAKSLVITGDKGLTVGFTTSFGTASTGVTDTNGVSTIDASASTAGIKIVAADFLKIGTAWSGLTIKGGAGVDDIATGNTTANALTIETGAGNDKIDLALSATTPTDKIIVNAGAGDDEIKAAINGGKYTLGAGKDKIDVTAQKGSAAVQTTTITDIEKGDVIQGINSGVLLTKTNVDGAANLDAALILATATASTNSWFQYGSDTYLVINNGTTGLATGDAIVKITGSVDLSTSTVNLTDLTIA